MRRPKPQPHPEDLARGWGYVCTHQVSRAGSYRNVEPSEFLSCYVKLAFPTVMTYGQSENMWVRVMEVKDRQLIGFLVNEPVLESAFDPPIERGAWLAFDVYEILDTEVDMCCENESTACDRKVTLHFDVIDQ